MKLLLPTVVEIEQRNSTGGLSESGYCVYGGIFRQTSVIDDYPGVQSLQEVPGGEKSHCPSRFVKVTKKNENRNIKAPQQRAS